MSGSVLQLKYTLRLAVVHAVEVRATVHQGGEPGSMPEGLAVCKINTKKQINKKYFY